MHAWQLGQAGQHGLLTVRPVTAPQPQCALVAGSLKPSDLHTLELQV